MTPSHRKPSSRARANVRFRPASDSAIGRPTFFWLWVSDADRKPLISSKRSRCTSARSRPRSFGIRTLTDTESGSDTSESTCSASASCGITSGRTKLVTSSRCNPVAPSSSISRTLSAVAITSGSFWKPSRGPTSRTRTLLGTPATNDPALVRADADRAPVGGEHLDGEAQLAPVDDLLKPGPAHATTALQHRGDVLDAHLKADRRGAFVQVRSYQPRRGVLHHPDHPGRGQHRLRQRAVDVGQQQALGLELVGGFETHLQRIAHDT